MEKAVVLVEGETILKDIVDIDNYYFWEGEKNIEDYLEELILMSYDKGARKIYALLIGEKHVMSLEIEKGRVQVLDIGDKI